jgi:hypothetical protein
VCGSGSGILDGSGFGGGPGRGATTGAMVAAARKNRIESLIGTILNKEIRASLLVVINTKVL